MQTGMMNGLMGFGGLGMLLGFIILIALAIWIVRAIFPQSVADPLDIARERLARGEISSEEFERLSSSIKGNS